MTRRWQRRRRRDRPEIAALIICALGHGAALASLALTGPPPAVRVDALWVNDHRLEARTCLAGLALAVAATLLLLALRRYRVPLVILWVIALAAGAWLFSDRIPLIARVILNHAF